jgi:hypothetical protein
MPQGYSISIASDTKAFMTGVQKGIIEPLEEATDILQDIGQTGGRDLEKVERAAKESQDATEGLKKDFSDLQKQIRETGKRAKTDFADPMNRATAEAGRGVSNLKDEAKQNFGELASSFDGSLQGIADGIQGTLGGAAVAVGGAAGLAIGTLGLVGGALVTQFGKDAEAAEERIQSMYDSFIESGLNYLTEEQALSALSTITGDPERIKALEAQAERLGLPIQTILAAQVRSGQERNQVLAAANALLADETALLKTGVSSDVLRGAALERIVDEYKKLNGEQATAVRGADLYRATSEIITGQQILTNEEIQKRNKLLAETPSSTTVRLQVDETALTNSLNRSRTLKVNIEAYARTGMRVI